MGAPVTTIPTPPLLLIMLDSTKNIVFPANRTGKHLANLFISSCVFSTLSFGLCMGMLGNNSYFIIPITFGFTILHHITIHRLLTREYVLSTSRDLALETRFRCLRHVANFGLVLVLALAWLAGSVVTVCVHALNLSKAWPDRNKFPPVNVITDMGSAVLAILEGGILFAILALCWELRSEVKFELSKTTPLKPMQAT
ncbi:unnamed protein product [Rhizoctonia solani]|uniref:Uncharacterized protein n=1 Tax=Rhizoctonia solani TaxID=456999 RepID=A0A8H3BYI2_9AGAM|nr:unnamed protein product [Rhizoctonia solani]